MFAVIKTGGKQYKVSPGDIIKVEKLNSEVGDRIDFSSVMMIGNDDSTTLGSPLVEKILVSATVLEQKRDRKIIIYKKKRRQGYDRKKGHRQWLSVLYINEIMQDGKSLAKAEPREPRPALLTPVAHHHKKLKVNTVQLDNAHHDDHIDNNVQNIDVKPAQKSVTKVASVKQDAGQAEVTRTVKAKTTDQKKEMQDLSADTQAVSKPQAKVAAKKPAPKTEKN